MGAPRAPLQLELSTVIERSGVSLPTRGAPAFHQGPRPLHADSFARSLPNPRSIILLNRVLPRFKANDIFPRLSTSSKSGSPQSSKVCCFPERLDAPVTVHRKFRSLPSAPVDGFVPLIVGVPLLAKVIVLRTLLFTFSPSRIPDAVLWPRLTSARCSGKTSPGNAHLPSRLCPSHLRPCFPDRFRASEICASLPSMTASRRFLFVEPALCLRLPSDPISQWTPLPFS